VEVIAKPGGSYSVSNMSAQLAEKIRAAANAVLKQGVNLKPGLEDTTPIPSYALSETTHKVIAIGASTGGTEALKAILTKMPPNIPGIVVVQHMPAQFTSAFAERLNSLCQIEVREAKDNDSVINGTCLIAPGNYHMLLRRSGARYYVEVKQDHGTSPTTSGGCFI